jgi:hypothetical protein
VACVARCTDELDGINERRGGVVSMDGTGYEWWIFYN